MTSPDPSLLHVLSHPPARSVLRDRSAWGVHLEPFTEEKLRTKEVRRRARCAVPLVVEANHGCLHTQHLEGRIILLRLRHRRPQIVDPGHEHGWRRHVADIHERRATQVLTGVVPREIIEVAVPADPVRRTDKRKPICHGTVR